MNIQDVLSLYKNDPKVIELAQVLETTENPRIHLLGLIGSSDAMVAISLYLLQGKPMVFILPDREEAAYFQSDIESLLEKEVMSFPSSYRKAINFMQADSTLVLQRAQTLSALNHSRGASTLITTYPEALIEKILPPSQLKKQALDISLGAKISMDFISEFLSEYHFERVDFVYRPGQFAVRGGIVDVFSFANDWPYRIEFFEDTVESIRSFEVDSQLSKKKLSTISIVPNIQSELFHEQPVSLFEYLPPGTSVWLSHEAQFIFDAISQGHKKTLALWAALSDAEKQQKPEWKDLENYLADEKLIASQLRVFPIVEFGQRTSYQPTHSIRFEIKPQPSFNKDFDLLIRHIKLNEAAGIENLIFTDSTKQIERLYSIFGDIDKSVSFKPVPLALRQGFVDHNLKLACYTDHQIFNRFYKYKLKKAYSPSQAITLKEFRELKPGDFITHIDHGIGKYAGLEKVEVNGMVQEMIRLVYADNDLLYVNINSLNRISKFSGQEGASPKLHKLGSDTWEKLKKNTKKKLKDIARDLIKLYATRKAQAGYAFSQDTYLQTELEASFLYEDTLDQEKATADVKKDMEAPHPMDRLICGDVGFGKTEIAIRAAFKAVADSKQVAVLVPTTILAMQHFKTFSSRLAAFPCQVDYINRFKPAKKIKETLQKLTLGEIDVIIGTHRLVSKDVKFKDLGLLIIDEEQKFGVGVKEKLKQLRANVDTLTLTATPIPRTLHFSLMGARDLSIISTPPPNRQPVLTELHVFNEKLIKDAIEYEIQRGGQVFFVHNRIGDLTQLGVMIKKLIPTIRIGIAHGQLDGNALEDVMLQFVNGDIDLLLSTSIVESGLDIPNANTIIINHAHMFGLSDLHQMRGRVGRSNRKAFCYLLSTPPSTLTSEARRRLNAIEEFSDLGSGFNVAMRDLDIRGSGNLLGAEQSGFIAEIGFEMYHKILDEAVQELKDEEFKGLFPNEKPKPFISFTQVDTDLGILIPDDYVTNITERYNLYTELSKLENEDQLSAFSNQLIDRFGPLPKPVKELFNTIRLQWLGKKIGLEKITLKKNTLRGYFIANKQSPYFESMLFSKVLHFAQTQAQRCSLKETKNTLLIRIEQVKTVQEAIKLFEEITQPSDALA